MLQLSVLHQSLIQLPLNLIHLSLQLAVLPLEAAHVIEVLTELRMLLVHD